MRQPNHEHRFVDATSVITVSVRTVLKHPRPVNELDPRGYRLGYDALLKLAARTDWADPRAVLGMMYAAYGWMPTVLKVAEDWKDSARLLGNLVDDLRGHERSKEDSFRVLDRAAESGALVAANRSVVGTSKLLHFACPDFCPIWDKVIATRFGYPVVGQSHNSSEAYIRYARAMHTWLDKFSTGLEELGELAGHDTGRLRRVEFALFLAARTEGQTVEIDDPQ